MPSAFYETLREGAMSAQPMKYEEVLAEGMSESRDEVLQMASPMLNALELTLPPRRPRLEPYGNGAAPSGSSGGEGAQLQQQSQASGSSTTVNQV